MKRSSKMIIVSVVSLGLVSVVAARQFGGPGCGMGPDGMPGGWVSQKMAWKLDLNDAQRAQLDELRDQMFVGYKEMREQRPVQEEIEAVLGDKLDRTKALAMLDQRLQKVRDHAPETIDAFADFYDSLDAEQQAELGRMIERRLARGHRHWGGRHGGEGDRGDSRG